MDRTLLRQTRRYALFACLALLVGGLTACGGMSGAQTQSLNQFINDLDQMYADGDAALASGKAELGDSFVLQSNKTMLDIVNQHMAAHRYPAEVQQHFVDLQQGLEAAVQVQSEWQAKGMTRDTAPADQAQQSDDATMQFTYAEAQLRIAAGR